MDETFAGMRYAIPGSPTLFSRYNPGASCPLDSLVRCGGVEAIGGGPKNTGTKIRGQPCLARAARDPMDETCPVLCYNQPAGPIWACR